VSEIGTSIAVGTRATVHSFGPDRVAKVPLVGTSDAWIRYESIYTAAVRAIGAPAPEFFELLQHQGRTVGIYERVVGQSMWERVLEHPGDARVMGELLGELHNSLARIPPPITLPRQVDRLSCKIRRAAATVDSAILSALNDLPAPTVPAQLCHGDLHPGNVLLGKDGPVVIDWFDACRGNAQGDLARSALLMGAGGLTERSLVHLPGGTADLVLALREAFLETVVIGDQASAWLRIEAAARIGEGVDPVELLSVWRR
jgi:Phosphotransferase enzyme family